MKKRKDKQKKNNKSPEIKINEHNKSEDVTKEVGSFQGFLIFDKKNEKNENNQGQQFDEFEDPLFQDWLIIQHHSNKTKSRFSNLFQEILENDKKKEKNNENNINNIDNDINGEKLIPNNLMEDDDDEDNINNYKDEIIDINQNMNKLSINDKNDSNIINNNINNNIIENNFLQNIIDDEIKLNINENNSQNNNIINNNFPNINNSNNNFINNNIIYNYGPNINNIINPFTYLYQNNKMSDYAPSNINSGNPSNTSTQPSSIDLGNSIFNFLQNSISSFGQKKDSLYYPPKNSIIEENYKLSEKKFELNIYIKRIIYLEDRRTTLMIKNIPNKFHRNFILDIIDQKFKGAYDLFILPTDSSGYKNFGYSFINFTSCYYIPYFYFVFNNKKWASTNSKKICEITYS